MTKIFEIIEVAVKGKYVCVRGRAEAVISVGDKLTFVSKEGGKTPVTVIKIETYGRETSSLERMWTGDVILSCDAEYSLGTGFLYRD